MELLERARGMMVGIGAGNLLGLPFEGMWTAAGLREAYPGGVREIMAPAGQLDDDDLAQAILLAEACLEFEALEVDDLARRLREWVETNGAGIGIQTSRVLGRYRSAPPLEASRAIWEDSGRDAAGNGSVMRCGPVALRWLGDDAALARNSAVSAAVTHWDPRCIWSTLLADFAIAACLRGEVVEAGPLLERTVAALRAAGDELSVFELPQAPPSALLDAVETALAPGAGVADLRLDSGGIGYAPKTLGAVLWAARWAESVEEGLSAIVSAGGDTDTNAAPAGAALGARFGLAGIPLRWREAVTELRAGRGRLEEYAERLVGLSR